MTPSFPTAGLAALALAGCLLLSLTGCDGATPPADEAAKDSPADSPILDNLPWEEADGTQATGSGLEYKVLRRVDDPDAASPQSPRDRVTVMYEGRLARNGELFDSSYARDAPATFALNQVIPGWTEGLQLMSEGESYLFYIPADLAYGDRPRPGGPIQPGDDLIFRVELQDVEPAPPPRTVDTEAWDTYTPWQSDREGVQTLRDGIEYVVLEQGDDDAPSPAGDDRVVVFYEGRLDSDGTVVDSAFDRGQAAMFPVNRVIRGWSVVLKEMRRGDRWLVHIPAAQAYGAQGKDPVPPNADLNFEIELMDVLPTQ